MTSEAHKVPTRPLALLMRASRRKSSVRTRAVSSQRSAFSRTELIEHIYDQDFDRDSNTIEVFVTRIRKKLGADVITTIRGLGYSLEDPDKK